jgi:hypothetical protein
MFCRPYKAAAADAVASSPAKKLSSILAVLNFHGYTAHVLLTLSSFAYPLPLEAPPTVSSRIQSAVD